MRCACAVCSVRCAVCVCVCIKFNVTHFCVSLGHYIFGRPLLFAHNTFKTNTTTFYPQIKSTQKYNETNIATVHLCHLKYNETNIATMSIDVHLQICVLNQLIVCVHVLGVMCKVAQHNNSNNICVAPKYIYIYIGFLHSCYTCLLFNVMGGYHVHHVHP